MENANINFPTSCKCSSVTYGNCPLFFKNTRKIAIKDSPATKVLAKVYQLNMVLYQCASILIIHNHGIVEPTDKPKITMYIEAYKIFFFIHLSPASKSIVPASSLSKLNERIFLPRIHQRKIMMALNTEKKTGLRNPFLPFKIGSFAT